jgi:adenosylmethionine-8-amino-7-oxononanoate aminotransferase
MSLVFNTNKTAQEMLNKLTSMFPEYNISKKRKNIIYVRNKKLLTIIKVNDKHKQTHIYGDFNLKNPIIILWLTLGILLTIVGLVFIFAALYITYNKKIKHFRDKIYNAIVNE